MDILKRASALLLAIVLLICLPLGALASDEPETDGSAEPVIENPEATDEETEEDIASTEPEDEPSYVDAEEPTGEPDDGASGETSEDEPAEEEEYIPASDGATLPDSLYIAQEQRGWCTLASAAMMLRARMFLSGNDAWSNITQTGIYSSAWLPGAGLYFNWTYRTGGNSITVSHATINGISVSSLKALLDKHPEGIVLYVYDVPHAILVTDYIGDTFYGSDPANSAGKGRKPIADTWLGGQCGGQSGILNKADAYWYVSSYSIKSTTWYTVKFDANGGSCNETTRSVKGGSALGSLPTATRSGFFFDGWYTDPFLGTHITESSSVTANTTLYAHWYAVSGSIAFSQSPATINFSKGTDSVSVTVTGTGYLNGVKLDFALEDAAAGRLWAEWDDAGDGTSRTVTFRADPSSSGTYHATFYMYDAETGQALNQRSITINVINEEPYLELARTSVLFAADSMAVERIYISYGGTNGDLPEGYTVECVNDHTEAVSAQLGDFDGGGRPLIVRVDPSFSLGMGQTSLIASLTLRLLDPAGGVCSEMTVTVSILATSGVCGGDYVGNVKWEIDGGSLRISVIDPASDEGGAMWNYETVYGRAPWYLWGESIRYAQIESGVTRIGSCAFYGCTALEAIDIPESVTDIGDKAFYGCTALESAAIPGSVSLVGEDVFHGCSALETLTLSEGVTGITPGALDSCTALRVLYVPVSMADLQLPAGTALTDIYYSGTQQQWKELDDACSISDKLPAGAVVHTLTTYSAADAASLLTAAQTEETGFYDAAYLLRQLVGMD